ncbi:hypothetical protein Rhe02_62680 [Rhizocola hellebori]|uniref:Uncharacterized protein n=1 Tax=Rhizocola hellebori TaxID=1392758 RepID=A0A8J3VJM4_9ACTN|nr:hypothetical protein [Rhizocola hellebori]GIH08201.1 hypothetical protein Rhe02_62680 [Rhizocola hellebori]
MKKRFMALVVSAVAALSTGLVATPAHAVVDCHDSWISAGSLGRVQVCYPHDYYSPQTLQTAATFGYFYVNVHDWTNDGISIYVEYQLWGSSVWFAIPNSGDDYGGPAASSDVVVNEFNNGQPIKYLRVHEAGHGAFSYLFKPIEGAGSGNGCGLENIAGDLIGKWRDGYIVPNCPTGAY